MAPLSDRKAELSARLAALNKQMQKISRSLGERPPRDNEDRAVERESDEILEGLGAADRQEAQRIRAALQRIEDGTYGICVKCGDVISNERLDLLPYTPFCRKCAK